MRRENDQYFTPKGLTRSLLRHVPTLAGARVLEPSAGMGHISNILKSDFNCRVLTNDIDATMPCDYHMDATGEPFWELMESTSQFDPMRKRWVVTNPPYKQAAEILDGAIESGFEGMAMLLRLSFLEPTRSRAELLRDLEPMLSHLIVFSPRPSFTENGRSDSVTSCWFVWQWDNVGGTRVINCTDWKEYND